MLRFAFDEAKMRDAALYVLYIREIAVLYTGGAVPGVNWREDPEASAILGTALQIGKHRGVTTIPLFVSAPECRVDHRGYGRDARRGFPDVGRYTSRRNEQVAPWKRRLGSGREPS